MLDADADPLVTATLLPGAEFVAIDVRPNAEVVQVSDRVFSDAALLTRPGAEERRREILELVAREVATARHGVLLVATRSVLRKLRQDVDPACTQPTDEDLMEPLHGASPRWFGPGMQGVNVYEDYDTAIIVGRLQPRIEAIEDQMRAVFGDREEPLAFMPFDNPQRGWYAEIDSAHLMADDSFRTTKIRGYPDPRGAAILELSREAYTIQAIGRIRAVREGRPKRILVLSSLVLPGLPVDRLVLWQELVTGLSAVELSAKSQRLETALYPDGRRWSVMGLRLSAAGIQEDAPQVFESAHSGREWRRDLTTESIHEMIRAITRRRGGRPTFVNLARPGGGQAHTRGAHRPSGSCRRRRATLAGPRACCSHQ
jgi:hypothetical protein